MLQVIVTSHILDSVGVSYLREIMSWPHEAKIVCKLGISSSGSKPRYPFSWGRSGVTSGTSDSTGLWTVSIVASVGASGARDGVLLELLGIWDRLLASTARIETKVTNRGRRTSFCFGRDGVCGLPRRILEPPENPRECHGAVLSSIRCPWRTKPQGVDREGVN